MVDAAELTLWTVTKATKAAEIVRGRNEGGAHLSPEGHLRPRGGQSTRRLEKKTEEKWPQWQVETRRTWSVKEPRKAGFQRKDTVGVAGSGLEGACGLSDARGEPLGATGGTAKARLQERGPNDGAEEELLSADTSPRALPVGGTGS